MHAGTPTCNYVRMHVWLSQSTAPNGPMFAGRSRLVVLAAGRARPGASRLGHGSNRALAAPRMPRNAARATWATVTQLGVLTIDVESATSALAAFGFALPEAACEEELPGVARLAARATTSKVWGPLPATAVVQRPTINAQGLEVAEGDACIGGGAEVLRCVRERGLANQRVRVYLIVHFKGGHGVPEQTPLLEHIV